MKYSGFQVSLNRGKISLTRSGIPLSHREENAELGIPDGELEGGGS
jgi:hypothetical protein